MNVGDRVKVSVSDSSFYKDEEGFVSRIDVEKNKTYVEITFDRRTHPDPDVGCLRTVVGPKRWIDRHFRKI